jgi:Zn finger protein HypA/HybF involved in hydrogenase expression
MTAPKIWLFIAQELSYDGCAALNSGSFFRVRRHPQRGGTMTKRHLLLSVTALCSLSLVLGLSLQTFGQAKPKDTVILKGSPMGGVKFEHKLHQARAGGKCETCHHPSKPEKPAKAAQQACTDCHTKPPQPGMKTGIPAVFHNPTAQAGTCIDCHKLQNASGKKAPVKCMDCHKKENV